MRSPSGSTGFGYSIDCVLEESSKFYSTPVPAPVLRTVAPDDAGNLTVDERPVDLQGYPGREYRLTLPDGVSCRVVRVFRVKELTYLLSVEGPFLLPDHPDVKRFFEHFYLKPKS